jgi:hypothetical protein
MKSQTKTLMQFLIYLVFIFGFCYWYTEVALKFYQSKSWFDLWPILHYMLFSTVFNVVFFFVVKLRIKFTIDHFSYLTTRTIALGLIFYIVWGLIIPFSFNLYYVFTVGMGAMTLFVLFKEKLIFRKTNRNVNSKQDKCAI